MYVAVNDSVGDGDSGRHGDVIHAEHVVLGADTPVKHEVLVELRSCCPRTFCDHFFGCLECKSWSPRTDRRRLRIHDDPRPHRADVQPGGLAVVQVGRKYQYEETEAIQ